MSNLNDPKPVPHLAILTSAGMGHLTPAFRLAALLAKNNCVVTFVTTHPTISMAEFNSISNFLSDFPQIISKKLNLLPFDAATANSNDPFYLHSEAIRLSASLLSSLLASSSPPLTALVSDMMLASTFVPAIADLCLPHYILFTSCATMFSLFVTFSTASSTNELTEEAGIQINDSLIIPKSWLPVPLRDRTNLFTIQFIASGKLMMKSDGILINTFEGFERELLGWLKGCHIVNGLPLPPVIPMGPLVPCDFERGPGLSWLDGKPDNSVVYVSFGSRTSMTREQIKEVGEGILKSGYNFLWVVKDKKVDIEDKEGVEEVVGQEFIEKAEHKGLVVKTWVDQVGILSHPAIGGFVTHCGWNSVTEAVLFGVPMLAWPQRMDQKINAKLVRSRGLGLWVEKWGWGEGELVKAEDIGNSIRELMVNESLKTQVAHVKEEAMKADQKYLWDLVG